MQFIQSTTEGMTALRDRLITELQTGLNVLWLLSGGSNIPICVEIMEQIPEDLTANLTLALTDERFGPVGHPDSNWHQLEQAGFNPKKAQPVAVLANLDNMDATVAAYSTMLQSLLAHNQVIIGQFGMGADGHIAGILPGSPAIAAPGLVAGYHTKTYDRITSTFAALKYCTAAYLFAFGEAKKPALLNLQRRLSLSEQPAQILKEIPEAYVYNDQLGGTV